MCTDFCSCQQNDLDSLEMELDAVGSCLAWVLGIEPVFSIGLVSTLRVWTIILLALPSLTLKGKKRPFTFDHLKIKSYSEGKNFGKWQIKRKILTHKFSDSYLSLMNASDDQTQEHFHLKNGKWLMRWADNSLNPDNTL